MIAVHVSVDSRYHIQSSKPLDDFTIPTVLTVEAPEGFRVTGIRYPQHVLKEFAFAKGKKVAVLENESVITATITAPADAKAGDHPLKAVLEFQPCDDNQCLPPDTAETTAVLKVGAETSPASTSGAFGADAAASVQRQQDEAGALEGNYFQGIVDRNGWLVLLVAIYIAGLGLSLTPCVFPLIPVTLGYFRGQASDDRRRTILLALTYVAGIATTYSVLGVLAAVHPGRCSVVAVQPVGAGTLAAIIAAMGISMFGRSSFAAGVLASRSGAKAGIAGAFVMDCCFGWSRRPAPAGHHRSSGVRGLWRSRHRARAVLCAGDRDQHPSAAARHLLRQPPAVRRLDELGEEADGRSYAGRRGLAPQPGYRGEDGCDRGRRALRRPRAVSWLRREVGLQAHGSRRSADCSGSGGRCGGHLDAGSTGTGARHRMAILFRGHGPSGGC